MYINIISFFALVAENVVFFLPSEFATPKSAPSKAQGKTAEAERIFRRALEGCEEKLGARHPHTLTLMNNLAGWEKRVWVMWWESWMKKVDDVFVGLLLFFFQKWCRVDDGHHFRMDRLLAEPPEHKICLQQAYDTPKTPKFFYQKQLIIQHMTYIPTSSPTQKKQTSPRCFV